jgi:hypothetical protein
LTQYMPCPHTQSRWVSPHPLAQPGEVPQATHIPGLSRVIKASFNRSSSPRNNTEITRIVNPAHHTTGQNRKACPSHLTSAIAAVQRLLQPLLSEDLSKLSSPGRPTRKLHPSRSIFASGLLSIVGRESIPGCSSHRQSNVACWPLSTCATPKHGLGVS